MAGAVHEGDAPRTIEESLGVNNDYDAFAALAICRGWPEHVAWADLDPWQRIGPELLESVVFQTETYRRRFLHETVAHLDGLEWVQRRRLSFLQLLLAADDAVDRILYRECKPSQQQALRVACRLTTYLELRAEAVAFLGVSLALATYAFRRAYYGEGDG
jgi:hypothetical protein